MGEWLRVHVTAMTGATKVRLKIRNGYQKTDKLWAANSRAHGLTVALLPSKKTVDVDLEDKAAWQEVAIEQPAGPLEAIELRVRSVYAGKKYDDLCLSDVQVFVTATTPDNPAFEKQRLQKIFDWKKERLEAARMFATKAGQALPIAAQYTRGESHGETPRRPPPPGCNGLDCLLAAAEREETEASKCNGDFDCYIAASVAQARVPKGDETGATSVALAKDLSGARFSTMTPVRISTVDKRPVPRVDGICTPTLGACSEVECPEEVPLPRALGYLDAQTLVTTEQSGLPSLREVQDLKPPQCHRTKQTVFAWVSRAGATDGGAPGQVRALLMAVCGMVDGREGPYPSAQVELLVYEKTGKLGLMADVNDAAVYHWEGTGADAKLASALVTNSLSGASQPFRAATAVAGK